MNALIYELLNGAELSKLIESAATFLNNSIMLCDISGIPIAISKNYPKDVLSDIVNNRKRLSKIDYELYSKKTTEIISDGKPHITNWPYVRNNNMFCGCLIDNVVVGFLSLPETYISLEKIDSEDVEFVSKIFAVALIINRPSDLKKFNGGHQFLWELITDKVPDYYLKNEFVWNIFNKITIYKLLWYMPKDRNDNPISDNVLLQIDSIMKNWWRIPFENGYAIITNGNDKKGLKALDDEAVRRGLLISSSEAFTDIKKTKEQFRLSQMIMQYAVKSGKNSGLAEYNDYKIYHLLSLASNQINDVDLQHDVIKYIKIYDNENNSVYGLTLRTYLICNMNIKETANRLCIHKNTVTYRINRLRELFNINFDDLKEVTTLYYSVLME